LGNHCCRKGRRGKGIGCSKRREKEVLESKIQGSAHEKHTGKLSVAFSYSALMKIGDLLRKARVCTSFLLLAVGDSFFIDPEKVLCEDNGAIWQPP